MAFSVDNHKVTVDTPTGAVDVNIGDDFFQAIKEVANGKGWRKFRILLNGVELDNSTLPEKVEEGQQIRVQPEGDAGLS